MAGQSNKFTFDTDTFAARDTRIVLQRIAQDDLGHNWHPAPQAEIFREYAGGRSTKRLRAA